MNNDTIAYHATEVCEANPSVVGGPKGNVRWLTFGMAPLLLPRDYLRQFGKGVSMRRLLLVVALLCVAARAEALPFLPDFASVTPNSVIFSSTGTNMLCLFCADADPLNDIRAEISLFPGGVSGTGLGFMGGSVSFAGTTATTLTTAFNEGIVAQITARLFDMNPEYPYPVDVTGGMGGQLVGVPSLNSYVINCCVGGAGPVFAQAGGLQPLRPFPNGAGFPIDLHLRVGDAGVPYIPVAVPEPTTFLLLGSGIVTATLRRRRAAKADAPIAKKHLLARSSGKNPTC